MPRRRRLTDLGFSGNNYSDILGPVRPELRENEEKVWHLPRKDKKRVFGDRIEVGGTLKAGLASTSKWKNKELVGTKTLSVLLPLLLALQTRASNSIDVEVSELAPGTLSRAGGLQRFLLFHQHCLSKILILHNVPQRLPL